MLTNINSTSNNRRKFSDSGGGVGNGYHSSAQIHRQNSRSSRSSTKSLKSVKSTSSTVSNLRKKIEEHQLQKDTDEWKKQQEYNIRRKRRKELRKVIDSKSKLQCVRKLYPVAAVFIVIGIVLLFGATIRSLSGGSVFWTHREQFKIVGPVVLVVGIVVLLTAVGLENTVMEKIKEAGEIEIFPFVHPDFNREEFYLQRGSSRDSTEVSPDSSINISRPGQAGKKWFDRQFSIEEEELLCSSIDSRASLLTSTKPGNDVASRWAKAMAMRIKEEESEGMPSETTADHLRRANKAMAMRINEEDDVVPSENITDHHRRANKAMVMRINEEGDVVPSENITDHHTAMLNNTPVIQVPNIDEQSGSQVDEPSFTSSFPLLAKYKITSDMNGVHVGDQSKAVQNNILPTTNGFALVTDIKLQGISEENVSRL